MRGADPPRSSISRRLLNILMTTVLVIRYVKIGENDIELQMRKWIWGSITRSKYDRVPRFRGFKRIAECDLQQTPCITKRYERLFNIARTVAAMELQRINDVPCVSLASAGNSLVRNARDLSNFHKIRTVCGDYFSNGPRILCAVRANEPSVCVLPEDLTATDGDVDET